ncbi:hypothetical protein M422DRAFT_65169 [Sphaerobolus stellatus SS14]|nr:hypothetical protein M422DRAFT_65169 [Sphaerobolus stellatus SS14]
MPFDAAVAVLQLSTKYMVETLRKRIILRSTELFPLKCSDIPTDTEAMEVKLFGESLGYGHYERLSRLSQECHLRRFLPRSFYILLQVDIQILIAVILPHSSPERITQIIKARDEIMRHAAQSIIVTWKETVFNCTNRTPACFASNRFRKAWEICCKQEFLDFLDKVFALPKTACLLCDNHREDVEREERDNLWRNYQGCLYYHRRS